MTKSDAELRRIKSKVLQKRIFNLLVLLVIIVGLYDFYLFIIIPQLNLPGESIPVMGREHIPIDSVAPTYNSLPPTSGPHYPIAAKSGVYKEKIPDGYVVHSLEHGRVLIAYKPGLNQVLVSQLEAIGQKYGCPVIVEPYPDLDYDIALASWGRLDKFNKDSFSQERVERFINIFEFKGPEQVPCPDSASDVMNP